MAEHSDGQVIHREFAVDLEATGDGRTLDMRVVPYNTPATVRDGPLSEPYDEVWVPGVFDKQLNAANRVLVNVEHEQGIGGMVGRGVELRSEEDGFHGTFRMLTSQDADKALELVNEGSFRGVSLEAVPQKSVREDGVVKRVKAHLINVALCRAPAFAEAQVLAVREEVIVPEPVDPPVRNDEVEERLKRIGFTRITVGAVTHRTWDPAPARFTDEEYLASCLIDRGGDLPVKERCSLAVLEPNGDINTNALTRAANDLINGRVQRVTPDAKAAAARLLLRYYRRALTDPPKGLVSVASR